MFKKIFITIFIFSIILSLPAHAIGIQDTQQLIGTTAGGAGVSTATVDSLAAEVIKTILGILGAVFFVLILYGGFTYMTAAGADEKIKKAKQIIIAAIIGLAIVIFAYSIAAFITTSFG
jgi:type IV secretion system pilin